MLEGKYTLDTKFDENDHRSHRPRAWLVEGLQKIEKVQPICRERGVSVGQLALMWLWAHPSIVSALPNVYSDEQLEEFAAASGQPPLTETELETIDALYRRNFDVQPYVETAAVSS
jgi:aryl-alcohol dehydrogenase-like predicted oxidoreductase